ncbi:MAG: leucine-rich repeat domain-containing protein [Bacteroidaceae bacterium]|nr:leucine-rich repeat domain-containing protein [Bacteroidaceae bacterium]
MRTIQILKQTLLTFLVLVAFNLSASAYDFIVDGIAYNRLSDTEVEVTGGGDYDSPENPNIVIPNIVNYDGVDYLVTTVGKSAFSGCNSYLKSIVIPESINKIDDQAFYDCFSLTSVNIPLGVTYLGNQAFYGCYHAIPSNLVLPEGLTYIGHGAFFDCWSLESITIPSTVDSYGGDRFNPIFGRCVRLKNIYIKSPYIGDNFRDVFLSGYIEVDVDTINSGYSTINGINYVGNYQYVKPSIVELPEGMTIIQNNAFSGNASLKSINIPKSVEIIETQAFSSCTSLEDTIVIPDNVISIGNEAFWGCSKVPYIKIGKGVQSIGGGAFQNCSSLKSIEIPDGVTDMGWQMFLGCASLISVKLPKDINIIREWDFAGCSSLKEFVIPEGVKTIGQAAFKECTSLSRIVIPSTVKSIYAYDNDDNVFYHCHKLDTVIVNSNYVAEVFPDVVRFINPSTVIFSDNVTRICDDAFRGLSKMTSFDISASVTSIGKCAFMGCSSLQSIAIPENVSEICESAFRDCYSLSSIILPPHITYIGSELFANCHSLADVIIPSSVDSIGYGAFYGCTSLSLIIPSNVNRIGENALFNVDVTFESGIPATLESEKLLGDLGIAIVPPQAFDAYRQAEYWHDFMAKIVRSDQLRRTVITTASQSSSALHMAVGEENLNSVMDLTIQGSINGMDLLVIRNKMKNLRYLDLTDANVVANDDFFDYYQGGFIKVNNELGANAFKDMNIRSVILPKSLKAIGDNAFNNCERLERVTIQGDMEVIGSGSFRDCSMLESVYISDGVKVIDSYAFSGCNKLTDLHMSANVREIGERAFYNCSMDTLVFGDSLQIIGNNAFRGNSNLIIVSLGNGMETLGYDSFRDCNLLESVDFGNHLVDIGSGVFYNCFNLKNIYIPNSVKHIGYDAFRYCSSIDTLYIGHNVEYIEECAFYDCSGIEDVTFGKSIKEIGPSAFEGCSNIKSIMLPTSLKYIRNRAFANCTGLKEFKIPSSVEKIENEAFGGNRKLESVYAYTIEPITIDQNTFSCWEYATLYVPKTSYYTYYLNKQWSQFMTLREFDEPYEYFYLNDDYLLDDETGRIDGVPDMLLNENSGIIVQGDATQQINEIELVHNGKDGASIIGGDGDVTGQLKNLTAKSMKVNIDVEGNRWYFFCFPFNVDLDSIECTSQYVFWRYDGNQRAQQGTGWTKLQEGTKFLSKGLGYIFQTNRTGILTIHVGSEYLSFNSQDEKEVLHTYTSDNSSDASWNFIGNPFISYYDTRDFAQEYNAPIITWNGHSYDVWKPGDDDEEPHQLNPFEGIFVQKASGQQSIEYHSYNRMTHSQSLAAITMFVNKRRTMGTVVNPDRLLVNLTIMDCDSVIDKTRIVYSTNASMDYEIGVDAPKFQSDGVPQLYSLAGGINYSYNERPMGNDEIKLGYVAPKDGVYTLSIPRMDADVEVYDNVMNSRVNFIDGNYDFTTKAGTFNDRFVIYKTGSSVTAIGKDILVDGMMLHAADGGINVSGNDAGQDVMVYLPSGALVATQSADGFVSTGVGTYIIKVGDRSVKMVVE